ncbi:hypothetical protein [Pseudomonas sp. W03]|uniref:hypothetical protein n=1 Tax=Pseudomonas sp. W03 TaxID=3090666 RepID=UPI003A4E1B5D
MPHVLKRVKYYPSPSRSRTYELDLELPPGDWLVWWYSSLVRNTSDNTVPLVNVIFRRLDGDTLTDTFDKREIALSRLCFYQPGLILVDNKVAERVVYETAWFDVSFSFEGSHWSFRTAKDLGLCQENSPYPLPPKCHGDWAIEFSMGKKRLQLNCIELLVRGYSRGSEIPRILTTYGWSEAKARLFSKDTPPDELIPKKKPLTGNEKWIVYPHKDMKKDDDLLLAHLANDEPYGATSARLLHAQLNNDKFKSGYSQQLQVRPWFNSATKLRCRGFWNSDGKSFLCTELVGMQMPSGLPIEVRRDKAEQVEGATEDLLAGEGSRLTPDELDSLALTDRSQPRSSYPREEIEDDSFEVLGDRCVERVKVAKPYERRKSTPKDEVPPEKYSTGDPQGQRDQTTGKVVMATRELGVNSQGVLQEMWKSFKRLQEAKQIETVGWFLPPEHIRRTDPPTCVLFSDEGRTSDQTKWLSLKDGSARGMLALIVIVAGDKYLVVEIQRDQQQRKGRLVEESFCGFICPIADSNEAGETIAFLDAELPRCEGKSSRLENILPPDIRTFEHRPSSDKEAWYDATAVLALQKVGVKVKRHPRREQATRCTTIVQP